MGIGKDPMNLYFVFLHLVYIDPQIPAGRIIRAVRPWSIVIMICILLKGGKNPQQIQIRMEDAP